MIEKIVGFNDPVKHLIHLPGFNTSSVIWFNLLYVIVYFHFAWIKKNIFLPYWYFIYF